MRRSLQLFGAAGLTLAALSSGMARQPTPPLLPDPKLTPGATLPVTKDDVCTSGYSKKIRNVPEDLKKQVYAEYGITAHAPGEYEVDHLISLELGGSNSIRNLWPQSYRTQPWNAHVKDRLEDRLHALVCSGQIDLKTAQTAISQNWITAYPTYVKAGASKSRRTAKPRGGMMSRLFGHGGGASGATGGTGAPAGGTSSTGAPANSDGRVWVNTNSGKYFKPDSRYYGKTKEGKYMTEAEAIKAGYQAAKGQ